MKTKTIKKSWIIYHCPFFLCLFVSLLHDFQSSIDSLSNQEKRDSGKTGRSHGIDGGLLFLL